jgi:hypothetical protein
MREYCRDILKTSYGGVVYHIPPVIEYKLILERIGVDDETEDDYGDDSDRRGD